MPITFQCPTCGKHYAVREELAGKRVKCKQCQETMVVPAAALQAEIMDDDAPPSAGRESGGQGAWPGGVGLIAFFAAAGLGLFLSLLGVLVPWGIKQVSLQPGDPRFLFADTGPGPMLGTETLPGIIVLLVTLAAAVVLTLGFVMKKRQLLQIAAAATAAWALVAAIWILLEGMFSAGTSGNPTGQWLVVAGAVIVLIGSGGLYAVLAKKA